MSKNHMTLPQAKVQAVMAALLLGGSSVSFGTTLVPDVAIPLAGTTEALQPSLAGTIVEDRTRPFSFASTTGTIQDRVVLSVDGTYDFYWRVTNNDTSTDDIGSFRLGGFLTSPYDADFRLDDLGDVGPEVAYLFSSPGGYVNFNFGLLDMHPGQSSLFMFLDTDATGYAENALMDVANPGFAVISALFSTFGPATAVPESDVLAPSLVSAVGFLAFAARKMRRATAA